MPKTLEELEVLLKKIRTAKELFGADPKRTYHLLSRISHPDRNPGEKKADEIFKEITRLYESLDEAPITIKSKKRVYTLLKILKAGDAADIHLAQSMPDKADTELHDYLLKISRIPNGEKLLENERKILGEILTKAGDTTYRKYFPTLVESFPAHDKFQKRVNVFTYEEENFYTGEELHEKLPAIDSKHIAWMFKRILTAIGFAHRAGFVHGAVLPPHVRINSKNHGVQLTSWGHAVPTKDIMTTVPAKYKDWYPPEVLEKKGAFPSTDIYLAAKTIFYLAGTNPNKPTVPAKQIPIPMQRFFQSCLLPGAKMRENDAWKLETEFTDLLKTLYGQPKFVKLEVPN
jgi:serine/threonine protein kinase